MNTATRLGVFTLGLGVVFAATYGAGRVAGPGTTAAANHDTGGSGQETGHHQTTSDSPQGGPHLPGGMLVSDRGYTLTPVPASPGEFAFRVVTQDGRAATDFDVVHDKRMHLIAARRDLSGFRHVHPQMDSDGTWRVASPLGDPGTWRVFADFKPIGGEPFTLGVDIHVPGEFTPRALPTPTSTAKVDGYTVTLDGRLEPGRTSTLTLRVSRDGLPVTDLQPYLGAYGHLVALREGDLAYLHVHPEGHPGDGRTQPGPEIVFSTEVPSAGAYRLYLDFQHADAVHTAEFTTVAADVRPTVNPSNSATPAPSASAHGQPGHHAN